MLKSLSFASFIVSICLIPFLGLQAGETKTKPNILFIYTDDQAFDTIAALGHPILKTPNMDRLVNEGVSFTNTYNQGAWGGAVCVASRSMLNTGRFLWKSKNEIDRYSAEIKKNPDSEFLAEFRAGTFPQLMKKAGYTTYFSGKWHVDPLTPRTLFDHVGLIRGGMPPTVEAAYDRPREDKENPWTPTDPKFKGHWSGGQHWAEALTESTLGFLEQAAKKDEPFFIYIAFNSPHDPRQAPQEYQDMYPAEKMDVPGNFMPLNPHRKTMQCTETLRDERLAPFPRTELAVKTHRGEYYAIISHLDTQIGRILEGLKKSGKLDNTYIILTSDNGLAVGSHGLFGKQNMYEHSMKIPLVICGPDIPRDKRLDIPVYLQDIVPSALEIASAEIPANVAFKSLLPLVRGEKTEQYPAIYGAYMQSQRMIRKGEFKLILYPGDGTILLFDLKNDPLEKTDLSSAPEYAETIREMLIELKKLQKETDDPLNLDKVLNKKV